jgi:hypothetical protein
MEKSLTAQTIVFRLYEQPVEEQEYEKNPSAYKENR